MSTCAGLLHTVPALADTFHSSVSSALPNVNLVHISDPWLLDTAVAEGVSPEVRRRVAGHIEHLVRSGADAVLVTCSSIGEAVEEAAAAAAIPVLRVDAPMAALAVREAAGTGGKESRTGRIAVLATLHATLGPTGRLIERAAAAAGANVQTHASVVEGAIAAREEGRPEVHDRLIAVEVRRAASEADVVVLAQASMARAIEGMKLEAPVLTSPESGVRSLAEALGR
jgi:glutamate racemase